MKYKLKDLPRNTVAFASPKALLVYKGGLYINVKAEVTLTCNPATGKTMRVRVMDKKAIIASCTIPHDLEVPVLDNWVIVGMSFCPAEIEKSDVGYSN
ncbi:hypothetical protein A3K01_02690 [candidate division WWE3 bacterium RIFOXYD1_FULL_43_17]|uniref:Uncharacterized protein n=3 Tax=Katanobacteria TaxID=422282 RepID=A0A1F4XEV2_UNCKA|nr:MAG: hypothetical protein UU59_C0006G0011 [candidate division WWE3 bacterium GW2011_GWE1_41_27]KKS60876.1 MAG: hypothetical protein UV26_C0001G0028 [candidate division WWE3 bacterium GW2011_GWF2_42_42]OGC80185.1 MAG: hypothetical protein A3K01_02690 [candidate division WWE3 bacterium RIFOXYD1_FULL_43_17]